MIAAQKKKYSINFCIEFDICYTWACASSEAHFLASLPTAESLNHTSLLVCSSWQVILRNRNASRTKWSSVCGFPMNSTSTARHYWNFNSNYTGELFMRIKYKRTRTQTRRTVRSAADFLIEMLVVSLPFRIARFRFLEFWVLNRSDRDYWTLSGH